MSLTLYYILKKPLLSGNVIAAPLDMDPDERSERGDLRGNHQRGCTESTRRARFRKHFQGNNSLRQQFRYIITLSPENPPACLPFCLQGSKYSPVHSPFLPHDILLISYYPSLFFWKEFPLSLIYPKSSNFDLYRSNSRIKKFLPDNVFVFLALSAISPE